MGVVGVTVRVFLLRRREPRGERGYHPRSLVRAEKHLGRSLGRGHKDALG